jgi:hypothetical protein
MAPSRPNQSVHLPSNSRFPVVLFVEHRGRPVQVRVKWISPYLLSFGTEITYLDGSLAGPQIVLNVGAVAVKATPLRGRFQAES